MTPQIIFSDFDGTLTDKNGHLDGHFLKVIEWCQQQSRELVIVSGRSLSWGHFFMTHFPVNYCIMEGGGVILHKNDKGLILEECLVGDDELLNLNDLSFKLQSTKFGPFISADSYGRRTDQAIEFFQLSSRDQEELMEKIKDSGANFSISSVHLNFWYGDISKFQASVRFLRQFKPEHNLEDSIYFGDALNDQSMFQYFHHSVGVSNIMNILDQLDFPPKIILEGEENSYVNGVLNYLKTNC